MNNTKQFQFNGGTYYRIREMKKRRKEKFKKYSEWFVIGVTVLICSSLMSYVFVSAFIAN